MIKNNENTKLALEYLEKIGKITEQKLDEYLPSENDRPKILHEAMRYSLFAGGKRLRPALAFAAYKTFGGDEADEKIHYAMAALEMLHTFSLIHDDLPCMDDDDFRRGMPTSHKKYGEATAVLSGDALCILAFELLAKTNNIDTVATMAKSLGTSGMLGGQMIDIESEGKNVDLDVVEYIHNNKTAALIESSLVIGAQLAGASEKEIGALLIYGRNIGLAFQVVDDILDIESTTEELGKNVGSDIEKGKATYPALIGIEKSREKAQELYSNSIKALESLSIDSENLKSIAEFIITRVN